MSDLISRQAVEATIHNYLHGLIDKGIHEIDVVDCNTEICKEIGNVPTAYDVDKAVKELETDTEHTFHGCINKQYAISIVKGAVKDE